MKLEPFRKPNTHAPREPLRSCEELAEELGVDRQTLAGCLGKDPLAPKPVFPRHNNCPSKYIPSEVRKWWAARNA